MKSKFIDIIYDMSLESRKELLEFIQSPYFNKEKAVMELGEYLLNTCKSFSQLDEQQLHTRIFGAREFNSTIIRVVLSKLYKLCIQYLNIRYFQQEQINIQKGSINYFRNQKNNKFFHENLDKQSEILNANSLRNEIYYEAQYENLQEEYEFLKLQKRQGEFKSKELLEVIEMSYLIRKMRYCTRINTIKSINKIEIEFPFIDSILNYIATEKLYEHSVLGFYYFTYLSQINSESEVYFDKTYEILQSSEDQFNYDELKDNYLTTINYCIRKVNRGIEKYNEILFNLYNKALQRGFLTENGILSRFTFRNISETGYKLKNYEWVFEFLHQYKDQLERVFRRSFFELQLARYYSCIRNYDKALELLSTLSFNDPLIELANRLERIKLLVETNNRELAEFFIESMKVYLRRHKNLGYHHEHYKNFIFYAEKLIQNKINKKLQKNLSTETKVTELKWLLSKFKESSNE